MLTQYQKKLLRELYYSWPQEELDGELTTPTDRYVSTIEQLWEPAYKNIAKLLHTDEEPLIYEYLEQLTNK